MSISPGPRSNKCLSPKLGSYYRSLSNISKATHRWFRMYVQNLECSSYLGREGPVDAQVSLGSFAWEPVGVRP